VRAAVLTRAWWETPNVRVLEFDATRQADRSSAPCGSHIALELPDGSQRSYSLINAPHAGDAPHRIAVQRTPASAGQWLTEWLNPGQEVRLSGPHVGFELAEHGPVLMLAGGIGITPFLGMLRQLEHQQRPWRLVYAVRDRDNAPFLNDLLVHGPKVQLHVDVEAGTVLDMTAALRQAIAGTKVYVCGPLPLLQAAASQRQQFGHLQFHLAGEVAPSASASTRPLP
jgi:ferredoxin-NADP reductase